MTTDDIKQAGDELGKAQVAGTVAFSYKCSN